VWRGEWLFEIWKVMNESFFGIEGTRGTTILRGEWLFEIWKVMNVSFFG
jgi:hypothetical protein